jgi:AAA15 family ATPase/GTPase
MLSEIIINNFRGISECRLENLKRINIFIGRNNQGKSSILEALYLASAAFNQSEPTSGKDKMYSLLNRRSARGINWNNGGETLWYKYDTSLPIKISCRWENDSPVKVLLKYNHPHPLISAPESTSARLENILTTYSAAGPLSSAGVCLIENLVVTSTISIRTGENIINEIIKNPFSNFPQIEQAMKNMVFIDVGLLHEIKEVEKTLWSKLVRERNDKLITTLLREGYEIQVEDLTYVPIANEFQLAVKLPATTVRVDDLGDGSRYSTIWFMAAALAKDTVILLEEPETHQHPAGLVKSLELLLSLVQKNNLQIFATTHSLDFLKLIEALAKKEKIDIAIYFVEMKDDGKIEKRLVSSSDSENLRKLGFDMRFLDIL